jgi:hypothetical protein
MEVGDMPIQGIDKSNALGITQLQEKSDLSRI